MDDFLTMLPLVPAMLVVGIFVVRRSMASRELIHQRRMNTRSDVRLNEKRPPRIKK
ncbi:hypothetical protein SAMN06265795_102327 [Noviherbaspirillum humi]|uniref:Uncharacterized protein n=1 Tax=Noviherbaspirillum humi TaxID=1688639 RepID=A0A239DT85_9BURK|nr:hypothetical protein [Noviherbaspirillum humi]SNS34932.1 hypothetical protein SAMN06265795_102327 [Noviherbaspirillum humi]